MMRSIATLGALVLLAAGSLRAAEPQSATVKADYVHVRSGPGSRYYATDALMAGDRVELVLREKNGWYRVRPPQGSFSWVPADAITLDGQRARVTRDNVPVAVGTSETDDRRDQVQVHLPRDAMVQLLPGQSPQASWFKIEPPPGEYRWVHEQSLEAGAVAKTDSGIQLAAYNEPVRGAAAAAAPADTPNRRMGPTISEMGAAPRLPAWAKLAEYFTPADPTAPQSTLAQPAPAHPALTQPYSPAPEAPESIGPCPPEVLAAPPGGAVIPGAPIYYPQPVAMSAPPTRHYLNLDALGFWVKGDSLPTLVTASPAGTPLAQAGVLGFPDTTVLYGNNTVNAGIRPGARVQGGIWIDPYQTWAVEGHYWALASVNSNFSATSNFDDDPSALILAQPFFDIDPAVNAESSRIVAFSLLGANVNGTITVEETSRVQSAGGGLRYAVNPYNSHMRFFLLGGYRFFELSEGLTVSTVSTPGADLFPFFDELSVQGYDSFSTRNTFNGGDLGLGTEIAWPRWTLGAETRLALGYMRETVTIDGRTTAIDGVFSASFPGWVLTQPSNIGSFSQSKFALIPSVDVKLGFILFPSMRITVGYNFTYVSTVVRPGDQVDTTVNTTQLAGGTLDGPARPAATMDATSLWIQGVTAGLDFRF